MAAGGEIWWPPVGRSDGRGWGQLKRRLRPGGVKSQRAPDC
jgi:hypothetical protein